eukprot:EG_transcript_5076
MGSHPATLGGRSPALLLGFLSSLLPFIFVVWCIAAGSLRGIRNQVPTTFVALSLGGNAPSPTATSIRDLPSREQQLHAVQQMAAQGDEVDVLVIGGGATGAGVALDAVTRGLSTVLLEAGDFAGGTSSKSTKLIHGGVRYLQLAVEQLDWEQFLLVREALHEREHLLKVGPHLSHQLPIMLPIYNWWDVPRCWIGLQLYDLIASSQALGKCYYVGPDEAVRRYPLLKREGLKGAVVYCDGMQNDSRMNVSIVLTAVQHGAVALNHVRVEGLRKDAAGQVVGVEARDQLQPGAAVLPLRAKVVINATGAFCDEVLRMEEPGHRPIVMPSSGAHITLPGRYANPEMGVLSMTQDGRVLFLLPWQGQAIAGTTDTKCEATRDPAASPSDVDFILGELRHYLAPSVTIPAADVLAAWSGIRPLVTDPRKATKDITRSHLVVPNAKGGLVTITGGKWTTYRQMAQDAVDAAIQHTQGALRHAGACRTSGLVLFGGQRYTPDVAQQLQQRHGLSTSLAQHLARNYGDQAFLVADLAAQTQFRRLCPTTSLEVLEAEVEYAALESARTASDVLARRTRLAFLDQPAAMTCAPRVVQLLGDLLGWSADQREAELYAALAYLKTFQPPGTPDVAANPS